MFIKVRKKQIIAGLAITERCTRDSYVLVWLCLLGIEKIPSEIFSFVWGLAFTKSFASLVSRVVGLFYTPAPFKTNHLLELTDIRWERLREALKAMQERNLCSQGNGYLICLTFNKQTFFVRSVNKKRVFQITKPNSQYYLLAYKIALFNYLKWFTTVKYTISVHTTGDSQS